MPTVAVALAALALAAPSVAQEPGFAGLSLATLERTPPRRAPSRRPDLALRLASARPMAPAALGLDRGAGSRPRRGAPVCSGGVCAPVVSVPGFEPRYGRAHRSEALVALLTRARVEPLATVAWALVATGLRLDWTPPSFDGPNAGGHGWGSVMLRLRLRLDANAEVVVPPRPR